MIKVNCGRVDITADAWLVSPDNLLIGNFLVQCVAIAHNIPGKSAQRTNLITGGVHYRRTLIHSAVSRVEDINSSALKRSLPHGGACVASRSSIKLPYSFSDARGSFIRHVPIGTVGGQNGHQ